MPSIHIHFHPSLVNKLIWRCANRWPHVYERRWAWMFPAWFMSFRLEVRQAGDEGRPHRSGALRAGRHRRRSRALCVRAGAAHGRARTDHARDVRRSRSTRDAWGHSTCACLAIPGTSGASAPIRSTSGCSRRCGDADDRPLPSAARRHEQCGRVVVSRAVAGASLSAISAAEVGTSLRMCPPTAGSTAICTSATTAAASIDTSSLATAHVIGGGVDVDKFSPDASVGPRRRCVVRRPDPAAQGHRRSDPRAARRACR